jgi:hypothetical protein
MINKNQKLKLFLYSILISLFLCVYVNCYAQENVKIETVTIAAGASLSNVIPIGSYKYMQIIMPSAWTTANLTFQTCTTSGGTFTDVYDEDGVEVNISASTSRSILFSDESVMLISSLFLKIRSGTTGTPVNQAAARTIYLILKR